MKRVIDDIVMILAIVNMIWAIVVGSYPAVTFIVCLACFAYVIVSTIRRKKKIS